MGSTEKRNSEWCVGLVRCNTILHHAVFGDFDLTFISGKFPDGCVDDPDSFCTNVPLGWVFAGIPYFLTLVFVIVANTMIYCKVRRTFRKTAGNRISATVRTLRVNTQSGTSNTRESLSVARGTPASPDEVKIRDVGIQSLLYVGASITMGIWFVFLRMKESLLLGPTSRAEEASVYWLLVIVQLTCPTQVKKDVAVPNVYICW